jgi:DNA-binding response OmpR family regulator
MFESNLKVTNSLEGSRILIVDDHAPLARNIAFLMQIAGFEAITAFSAEEALELLDQQAVDMVIVDAHMPRLSGFDLLATLKINDHTAHLPVVMTSSRYTYQDLMHALDLGAAEFLPKPFDAYDLVEAACGALRGQPVSQPMSLKKAS